MGRTLASEGTEGDARGAEAQGREDGFRVQGNGFLLVRTCEYGLGAGSSHTAPDQTAEAMMPIDHL